MAKLSKLLHCCHNSFVWAVLTQKNNLSLAIKIWPSALQKKEVQWMLTLLPGDSCSEKNPIKWKQIPTKRDSAELALLPTWLQLHFVPRQQAAALTSEARAQHETAASMTNFSLGQLSTARGISQKKASCTWGEDWPLKIHLSTSLSSNK